MDRPTEIFSRIAHTLKRKMAKGSHSLWKGSPFAWILNQPAARKGAIGALMIQKYCEVHNIGVEPSHNSDSDRLISGKKVEIKMSTLWKNGIYKFQQIRDQDYEYLICLGISPEKVHAWVMTKKEIPFNQLNHQHGGERGRDTWWIEVDPQDIPPWLNEFGGSPERILEVFGH